MENEDNYFYTRKIITSQINKMNLKIETKQDKLYICCFYKNEYITNTFSNSFSLEELKKQSKQSKQSKFYDLFDNVKEVLDEIKNNHIKNGEYIEGNEDTSREIKLFIPIPLYKIKSINFLLKKEEKSPKIELEEYKLATYNYQNELTIDNFKSKILMGKNRQKHNIKGWISQNKKLRANKLYSFYDQSYDKSKNIENKNMNNIDYKDEVRKFHDACDNKKNILILLKSKKEILGGFTPLSFDSSGKYKYNSESFLFSINKSKKYANINLDNSRSIFCHKNFGPTFDDDLSFIENKINVIKSCKKSYNTNNNWINLKNCFSNYDEIVLDSLEIFQIFEEEIIDNESDEEEEEENEENIINKSEIININAKNHDFDGKDNNIQEVYTNLNKEKNNVINDQNENVNETKCIKNNENDNSSIFNESHPRSQDENSLINKMNNVSVTEINIQNFNKSDSKEKKEKEDENDF